MHGETLKFVTKLVEVIRFSSTHNDRTTRAKVTELWYFQDKRKNFSLVVTTSRTYVEMTCFLFLGLWTLHYFCMSYEIQLCFIFNMYEYAPKMKKIKSEDKWCVLQGTCENSVCRFGIVRGETLCIINRKVMSGRSQRPSGLRRRSTAARLLRSWVRIPPRAWMFVLWVLCVVR